MATTCFTGSLLSIFFDEKIDENKQKALCYLGAMMAINDVFIDNHKYNLEKSKVLLSESYTAQNDLETLFIAYFDRFKLVVDETKRDIFTTLSDAGLFWQSESLKQLNPSISIEEIHKITASKGGFSILLCASIFDKYNHQFHQEALFHLGAFVQYLNDAQDVFKDKKENINNFATKCDTIDEILNQLHVHHKTCFQSLFKLPETNQNNNALFAFNFYIMYLGINYKLERYKKRFGNNINQINIQNLNHNNLKVNMLSLSALFYILPRLLSFKPSNNCDEILPVSRANNEFLNTFF